MSPFRTILLALLLALTARAQDIEPMHFEYVLDDQTELTIDSNAEHPKGWAMELRQYGPPGQGRTFTFGGIFEPVEPYVFECEMKDGLITRSVRVSGNPKAKEPLEVNAKNLALTDGKTGRLKGTFQPIEPDIRMVRAKERAEKAEAVMNDVFNRVLAEVGRPGEAKLREVEKARWQFRDDRTKGTAEGTDYKYQAGYWEAMLIYTLDSISFFRDYTGRGVPKGFAGAFRDASGGTLSLEPTNTTVHFTLGATRGPAGLAGQMTGDARLAGTHASYKEQIKKKDLAPGQQEAELTFVLRDSHIVHVEAKNTGAYAPEGVSFTGDYYKIGPPR